MVLHSAILCNVTYPREEVLVADHPGGLGARVVLELCAIRFLALAKAAPSTPFLQHPPIRCPLIHSFKPTSNVSSHFCPTR
jgi:hypothetical protein